MSSDWSEECPGNETHSSYLCPPFKVCCEQLCCDVEWTVTDTVILAVILVFILVGALALYCWVERRANRDRGERWRLLR
ncbi:hypothetical protein R5R35_005471 [Gryllus longicercus]|uniref:Uncharacterized protein n=1 Tax=Gryllus longicercus TaxID=2509291 RepID=A0AAN9ZE16_9ORTH